MEKGLTKENKKIRASNYRVRKFVGNNKGK